MQEPSKDQKEILAGYKYVRPGLGTDATILITNKIEVNGEKEHPLFTFLKKSCPQVREGFSRKENLFSDRFFVRDIRWNFEKFLIDPTTGYVYKRYAEATEPIDMKKDIQHLLKKLHREDIGFLRRRRK